MAGSANGVSGGGAAGRARAWLTADRPASALQARCGRIYAGARAFARNPLAVSGAAIVLALLVCAAAADPIAPYSPDAQDLSRRLAAPGAEHWLGTDALGRDVASRLVHGSRITLEIVLLVAALAAPAGLALGCAAGYAGGAADLVLMRLTDIVLAFPRLVLALALAAALGPGMVNAVIAIAATSWPVYARVARAETLRLRRADFIAAARMSGAPAPRILFFHIAPLCLDSVIVRVSLDMAGIVVTAAGLGFLGLGAQPPAAEWGAMIADGRDYLFDNWWLAAAPGAAILVVSVGFNLLGDGLRDTLDPRLP